ncbi:MAG: M64 family metallopeptidase [Myxococcales bacterium]
MRRSLLCSLVTVALAGCPNINNRPEPDAGAEEEPPVEACGTFEIPAAQIDSALPWPSLKCADFPGLCSLQVEKTVAEPDTARAVDIVFVGDGFTEAKLPEYRELVASFTKALTGPAGGFVARRPRLFNFYRVDVVSESTHVGNADRADSALAGCVDIANTGNLVMDERLAGLAATANVPPGTTIDVIVVVMRTNAGSPNASAGPVPEHPAFVRINPLVSEATVNHEFGHALFHLGDEYALEPACYTPPDLPAFMTEDYLFDLPNVSSEETGKKWASIYQGAVAGGLGYRYCLYHPGPACLMNEGALPFCAICSHAIDRTLDAWEGKNDGAPRCGLELSLLPTYVHGNVTLGVSVFDRNPPTHYSLAVDGTKTGSGDVAAWQQRVPGTLDSTKLGNGVHTATVDCRDALGATSHASVEFKVQN